MDIFVYGALCAEGEEHQCAYRLLATAVQQVYGISALPEIAREDGGKPYFPKHRGIFFNISHSHGAAICAVHDHSIGVDIEKLRPAPKRLAGSMSDRDFFCLWTEKEASVKRIGKGVGALLRDFEPDPLCRTYDDLLPGWIVTICPSEAAEIRFLQLDI